MAWAPPAGSLTRGYWDQKYPGHDQPQQWKDTPQGQAYAQTFAESDPNTKQSILSHLQAGAKIGNPNSAKQLAAIAHSDMTTANPVKTAPASILGVNFAPPVQAAVDVATQPVKTIASAASDVTRNPIKTLYGGLVKPTVDLAANSLAGTEKYIAGSLTGNQKLKAEGEAQNPIAQAGAPLERAFSGQDVGSNLLKSAGKAGQTVLAGLPLAGPGKAGAESVLKTALKTGAYGGSAGLAAGAETGNPQNLVPSAVSGAEVGSTLGLATGGAVKGGKLARVAATPIRPSTATNLLDTATGKTKPEGSWEAFRDQPAAPHELPSTSATSPKPVAPEPSGTVTQRTGELSPVTKNAPSPPSKTPISEAPVVTERTGELAPATKNAPTPKEATPKLVSGDEMVAQVESAATPATHGLPDTVYHGTSPQGAEALSKEFSVLSPEEKLKLPSTGGGKVGLSTSTDKATADQYAQALGGESVPIKISPNARVHTVDTGGRGIDEAYTPDQLNDLSKHYDVIHDPSTEGEARILTSKAVATGDSAPLKPAAVEGETRTSGLAAGVEQKAVENKLATHLGDLPEYSQVNMKDQAAFASDLLAKDEQHAISIAKGESAPPGHILPESVFTAVENKALNDGNVSLLQDLANSTRTTEATAMGQRIRALAERDPNSAVGAMKQVADARAKAIEAKAGKGAGQVVADIAKEIKSVVKASGTTRQDWNSFIESIKC